MKARLLMLLTALLASPGAAFAQKETPAEGMDLVYFRAAAPGVMRLRFHIGEQPLDKHWQDYIGKLFTYFDRDADGFLDGKEILGVPKTNFLAQLLRQGNFFPTQGSTLTLAEMGKANDGKASLEDLIRHYRKGAGPVQALPANTGNAEQLSQVLFDALDLNKDGRLAAEEIKSAWTTLAKRDQDDDEVMTAQEIGPGVNPFVVGRPGGFGGGFNPGVLSTANIYSLTPGAPRAQLVALLLSKYDADKNGRLARKEFQLDQANFQALDLNQDSELDAQELANWPNGEPDYVWDVRIGKTADETTWALKKGDKALDRTVLAMDDLEIGLSQPPGNNFVAPRNNFFQDQIRAADKTNRGFVEVADLQGPQFQFARQAFGLMDRDADGKLTNQEVKGYFDLQADATSRQVTINVAEQGRTLFQILDGNRDGRLSQRELRSAWTRLQFLDRDGDGAIAPTEIPRQIQIAFGQGLQAFGFQPGAVNPPRPINPLGVKAPVWFRKMDTNADGDVSSREFLGTREEFRRIDTDNDGLIDPQEADVADRQLRKK